MQAWAMGARAAAGAVALMLASGASAQDTPIPRAEAYAELAKLPNFGGVWGSDRAALGQADPPARPQLTPAAQTRLDAFRKKQEEEGVSQFAQAHCIPPGMPSVMNQPYPIEIAFQPDKITIYAEAYGQQRRVYTDGRELPEDPDLLFNGTSVGHWDGDTLVVDTVGFSPLTNLTMGIPNTPTTRIRERIWLQSPDVLRIETTITDPDVLAAPFVSQAAFRRRTEWDIREYVCAENNRLTDDEGGANIDLGFDDEEDPFGALPEE
jgi:hypothetical protein